MSLPERLGRLRRIDRIGAGGFATVWLYHDDELDSPVAIKALADNWAVRDDVCDRFLEEARILRRADSDHVVRVYDIGESDGTPYFVMSYADRGSVGDLLTPGQPLPPARVVDLLCQAADGLAVLHGHGVIHRDVKPQNLLIRSTPDGGERVMVADLGVAKAMLHASGLTQVVGTPAYMAPEQAIGIGLDRRADVHALGAVGYHLLTGQLVRNVGLGGLANPALPPEPSTIAPVPAAYDAPVMRALQLAPDDRWPDVTSFVGALRRAQERAERGNALPRPPVAPAPSTVPVNLAGQTPQSPVPSAVHAPVTPFEPVRSTDTVVVGGTSRPSTGPRALRLVLICLLVLAVSFGIAFGVTRLIDRNSDGGSPSGSPSDSTTGPTTEPAPDIDFRTLAIEAGQRYETHTVTTGDQTWHYPAPEGWVAYRATGTRKIAPANVDRFGQVRWRPKGEPLEGGYSLRVEARTSTDTVAEAVEAKVAALEGSPDLVAVDIYEQTDDTIYFTYRDGNDRLRYNFFRWVANEEGEATFEVSVAGRRVDEDGLSKLLDAVTQGARTS